MTRDNIFEAMGYWEFVRKYMGPDKPHIDMEELHAQIRMNEELPEVFCPFGEDFVCIGGCPSMQERACINGE